MSLKKLGLSDYESKIYTALLRIGRADARKISKESKIPPTAVYPNLRALKDMGFVEIFEGENYLYDAIKPEIALRGYEEQKILEMKQTKEEALNELKKNISAEEQFDPIRLSYGKQTSQSQFEEFSIKAKKRVYVAGWKFSKTTDVPGMIRHVKLLLSNSVDVRIIFREQSEITRYLSREIVKVGAKVKYADIGNFSIIIFDDKLCKISLKSEDRKERINILIDDRDLSRSMTDYFNTVWKKASN
jgi:HTH-type transcriptional regulator, sugar sensing transcriptional regulator